jgi:rSAM/selenodomain-associated transferase 1
MNKAAIAILSKAPKPGVAKTRLCPPLSPESAAELSKCFLEDTILLASTVPGADTFIAYTPSDCTEDMQQFAGVNRLICQPEGDLGHRQACCIQNLFNRGYSAVLLVRVDCPTLPPDNITRAVRILVSEHRSTIVLGPSVDGGYYLLGVTRPEPELFRNIVWSTPLIARQLIQRANMLHIPVTVLPQWHDVDTINDLMNLRNEISSDISYALRAPKTAEWLGKFPGLRTEGS